MSRGENFWSRRMAAVEAETQEADLVEAQAETAAFEAAQAQRSDEDILAELDLPDPDTLQQGDDFKVFLTEALPARIRTRALRRLWTTNPVLANVDGLVDYGEDFTDAAKVIENLQTAYQVGKGMTAHVEELARQAEEAELAAQADPEADADVAETLAETEAEECAPAHKGAAQPEPMAETSPQSDPYTEEPDTPALPPRRMRFHFETTEAS